MLPVPGFPHYIYKLETRDLKAVCDILRTYIEWVSVKDWPAVFLFTIWHSRWGSMGSGYVTRRPKRVTEDADE